MSERHRGPQPRDAEIFTPALAPALRAAVGDLSWLLGRDYSETAALALVGDRYQLVARARLAVSRMAGAEIAVAGRRGRRVELAGLRGRPLAIDGFNVLVTGESALAGALLLRGRDGALRDLGSVHGGYRTVDETDRVIAALVALLIAAAPSSVCWLLDRPVSNSGALAARLRAAPPSTTGRTCTRSPTATPRCGSRRSIATRSAPWRRTPTRTATPSTSAIARSRRGATRSTLRWR